MNIVKELFKLQNAKFRDFNARPIPTISKARESYRESNEHKEILKDLRWKE